MILFNNIAAQWKEIEERTLPKLIDFLRTGPYILGDQLSQFENNFAKKLFIKYAVGVSNGTDGLKLALQTINSQKRIFVPANAHISDALAAVYQNIDPIFIDCDNYYNINIEELKRHDINQDVIIIVHMYGQAANIIAIKKAFPNALIIEDCSQAFGATINNQPVGTFGDIAVFSLYPTKNLGAIGDAGIIVTNNEDYHKKLKALRDYGSFDRKDYIYLGGNYRLDDIQALILNEKLHYVDRWIQIKQKNAAIYDELLQDIKEITIPKKAPYSDNSTFHLYPIRTKQRDDLKKYLEQNNIQTGIHYAIPLHKTKLLFKEEIFKNAEEYSKTLLSLPMHPYLTNEEIYTVASKIKDFFK